MPDSSMATSGPREGPVRLGMIGVGAIGRVQLAVLRAPDQRDVEVVAVADPGAKVSTELDIYRDYQELLLRPDITAVAVNTPPSSHFAIALDALRAGKDVLLEKPPTLRVQHADELARVAADRALCLFTSFHARYSPPVRLARALLEDEQVVGTHVVYRECVYDYHPPDGWIFDQGVAGGGVLMDSGVNALSVLVALAPGMRDFRVQRVNLQRQDPAGVETAAEVTFSFGNVATGSLDMDWLHDGPETRRIDVMTQGHEYVIDLVQATLHRDGEPVLGPGDRSRRAVDQHAEYRAVYQDFAQHVASRRSSVSTTELAFVQDCYSAARDKRAPQPGLRH